MTIKDLEEKLKQLGIKTGTWTDKPSDPEASIPAGDVFKKQEEALLNISALLESQLKQDQSKLADLHIALNKAKYGSGR